MTELLHVAGKPPRRLEMSGVLQVLRRGHQRPLVCLLEEAGRPAGLWLVKPAVDGRSRGVDGQLMALCELAGSKVCAHAGVPTPSIGLVRIPEEPLDLEPLAPDDRALVAPVLAANRGRLAFCSRWLENSEDALTAVLVRPRRRRMTRRVGYSLLLVDALIRNVDRRIANPNALLWHGDLVAIDHGQAFQGIERAEDVVAFARGRSLAFNPYDHLVVEVLRRLRRDGAFDPTEFLLVARLGDALDAVVEAWPDELDAVAKDGTTYKTRLRSFLMQRIADRAAVVEAVAALLIAP